MEPTVPPEKRQSEQPSSSSLACAEPNETELGLTTDDGWLVVNSVTSTDDAQACAEPNEKAVETHRVDTEQATVTKAALFRLFADVTSGVPDWTDDCAALPLLPSRASQKRYYDILKSLRENQARYVHLLTTIKESYFDAATEWDLAAAKHVLRRESQKLSLLESRLEIYTTVSSHVTQVPYNEVRLPADHTSKNGTN